MRDWFKWKRFLIALARALFIEIPIVLVVLALVLPLLPGVCILSSSSMDKARLVQSLSHAKVIQVAMSAYLEDNPGKKVYPADVGAKTRLEYIQYLVKIGVLAEKDALGLFGKHHGEPSQIKEMRPEDLRFRIVNVSSKDSPDTLFLTSENYVVTPVVKRKSWFSWGERYKKGIVVLLLGCEGAIYSAQRADAGQIGILPSREPAFLGD